METFWVATTGKKGGSISILWVEARNVSMTLLCGQLSTTENDLARMSVVLLLRDLAQNRHYYCYCGYDNHSPSHSCQ
jgi:hypothetical protein